MALRISDDEGSWEITVPLEGPVLQALKVQMARVLPEDESLPPLCQRIGERMAVSILEVLDVDLKPPTQAQVSFAIAIARELNVNLHGEALIFRGAMSDFLTRYATLLNEIRSRPK